MNSTRYFSILILVAVAGLFGCVDEPASPDATVGEAVERPSEAVAEESETVEAIKEESSISWIGRKVTGKHDGGFEDFDASLTFANGEPQAIDVEIDMTSIWSDTDRLTAHLKSGDFFLVEEYPAGTFESTSIESRGTGAYEITGNLDMRGETKSITFPAEVDMSGDTINATASFTINRHDWNVSFAGMPDDLIKDEVEIMLDITFPKPAGASAGMTAEAEESSEVNETEADSLTPVTQ